MTRKNIPVLIKMALLIEAGGRCSKCKIHLVGKGQKSTKIEVFHHIRPIGEHEPWHDPELSADELNHPDNILVICPTCHIEIHSNSQDYPPNI